MLWSIVAGPLVNVILLPLTLPFLWLGGNSDAETFLKAVASINVVLLVFNMLPIYPLDGGKILWSLLWFPLGIGRSLMIASVIGIIGAAGLGVFALSNGSIWLALLAAFAGYQAWIGVKSARSLARRQAIVPRQGVSCPVCGVPPPVGQFWVCGGCHARFDAFGHPIGCPGCGRPHLSNTCLSCGARTPFSAWTLPVPPPAPAAPANAAYL